VVNQVVIVPIGGESSKRGAVFGTGVTSGTGLSVVRVVILSNRGSTFLTPKRQWQPFSTSVPLHTIYVFQLKKFV
jgi:hypothetical protein